MKRCAGAWTVTPVAVAVLGALSLAPGCIDTEPGLAVSVQEALVLVEGAGVETEVSVELRLRVRVGKYALSGRDFELTRASLFGPGDTLAAEVVLGRPSGFSEGSLEPGEAEVVTVTGSTPPGAFPDAPGVLCGDDVKVTVAVQYEATLTEPGSITVGDMELGAAEGTRVHVTCP